MKKGKVYLVGGGPGSVDLLTLKGLRCLQEGDVVVYDSLVASDLLALARPGSELIYAGKHPGSHAFPQEEINRVLVEKAQSGSSVVRLKGGDPFIFGRGGEEAEALAAAGVEFEIVPGITSAVAVPAYAGIPLTHRNFTSSVAILSGHDAGGEEEGIDWEKISTGAGTLVFLMGVSALPRIARRLQENGLSPRTPVAVIQWGTTARQRTVEGTLETIAERVQGAGIAPPAVTVVGDVVSLRARLRWCESLPLFGQRILVTRARSQAARFSDLLRRLGAQPLEFPVIEIVPPESWEALDGALSRLSSFSWLILTSANGVDFFLDRLFRLGKDVRDLKGIQVAAIGSETAAALTARGVRPDLVPAEFRAEGLVESLRGRLESGSRVLLARAEKAREVLPEELQRLGARVEVVTSYRTVRPRADVEGLAGLLGEKKVQVVTFTSSSTVHNFFAFLQGRDPAALLRGVSIGCIGPVTAGTLTRYGLQADIVPATYTIEGLAAAIVEHCRPSAILP